ncbi:MAG: hypothetical protein LBK67_09355 [Coriobacteriales bacterium]|jgi:hypothetical protein|nr:hypothetical protein [Coriobacteriales bacterium]
MAEVIHKDVRDLLSAEMAEEDLSMDTGVAVVSGKAETLAILEHRRWLAYMRAEGFVFSGSTDESSRYDQAKMHNLLVSYNNLPESEKKLSFDADA